MQKRLTKFNSMMFVFNGFVEAILKLRKSENE